MISVSHSEFAVCMHRLWRQIKYTYFDLQYKSSIHSCCLCSKAYYFFRHISDFSESKIKFNEQKLSYILPDIREISPKKIRIAALPVRLMLIESTKIISEINIFPFNDTICIWYHKLLHSDDNRIAKLWPSLATRTLKFKNMQ